MSHPGSSLQTPGKQRRRKKKQHENKTLLLFPGCGCQGDAADKSISVSLVCSSSLRLSVWRSVFIFWSLHLHSVSFLIINLNFKVELKSEYTFGISIYFVFVLLFGKNCKYHTLWVKTTTNEIVFNQQTKLSFQLITHKVVKPISLSNYNLHFILNQLKQNVEFKLQIILSWCSYQHYYIATYRT